MALLKPGAATLFVHRPSVRTRVLRTALPRQVTDLLAANDYVAAGDFLATSNLPFIEVYCLISNCIPLLCSYLYKKSTTLVGSPIEQQLICHMYFQTALLSLASLRPPRGVLPEKTHPYQVEFTRVKEFLQAHKSRLSKAFVLRIIRESGEVTAFTREALLAFQDYDGLVEFLVAQGSTGEIKHYILNIPPLHQARVLRGMLPRATMHLVECLDEKRPPMEAVFDTFTELSLVASTLDKLLRKNVMDSFEEFYGCHHFTKAAHFHIYLIFLALLGQTEKISEFLGSDNFPRIDADFIVAFFVSRNMFSLAADVYARVPTRHLLAVQYAMRDSLDKTLELFKKELSEAHDIRQCWLLALRTYHDSNDLRPEDWTKLIQGAVDDAKKGITLDDVFPLVPRDIALDALHTAIAAAVQASTNDMKASEDVVRAIEARAKEQRLLVNTQTVGALTIETADAKCFLCGLSICGGAFAAYPCRHVVHVVCLTGLNARIEIGDSCPACGAASLKILQTPFVNPVLDAAEEEVWRVPE
jgi:hypothetical protein